MLLAFGYAFLFGLQIMYDVLLATWTLAALVCADAEEAPRRTPLAAVRAVHRPGPADQGSGDAAACGLSLAARSAVERLGQRAPRRWYGRGLLGVLLGGAMLLAWALPAGFSGGEAYRQRLFFTQTAGRVVDKLADGKDLQNHAEPFWFYLQWLPALLFPFSGWPRIWVAVASLRRPLETGLRFALCWLVPTFLVFSLISGKQLYYPLPDGRHCPADGRRHRGPA